MATTPRQSTQNGVATENREQNPQDKPRFQFLDSESLNRLSCRHEWLIKNFLIKGQPGVIGGPKKSHKTTLALDLAISLGSATPFVGYFEVPKRVRVAVMSGESGKATMQETARRICKEKGISLDKQCHVDWEFDLPCLSNPSDLKALYQVIRTNKIQVVIIDPLYLCLLGGGAGGASTSNLYEVGPLLRRAARAMECAGATPIFVHHAVKAATKGKRSASQPLQLDDLSFAGIGEFVRQWILIKPLDLYEPSNGTRRLLVSAGGSAGHSGCWQFQISEGALEDDLTGRIWKVRVNERNAMSGDEEYGIHEP